MEGMQKVAYQMDLALVREAYAQYGKVIHGVEVLVDDQDEVYQHVDDKDFAYG